MFEYRFATIDDTDSIMQFMDRYWQKNHVLSKSKELFLYDFLEDDKKLNIGLLLDKDNIIGIFGFLKYNYLDIPDLAGSLWKIREDYQHIPLLGVKLRQYVLKHIKHRFFAAPGANINTKSIYEVLGEKFYTMNQWYILNNRLAVYHIIKPNYHISIDYKNRQYKTTIKKLSKDALDNFSFNKDVYPFKDKKYIVKRFCDYIFYKYDIFGIYDKDSLNSIFICRKIEINNSNIYRVVDFYGEDKYIVDMSKFLYEYICKFNMEYVDFLEYGVEDKYLENSLFLKRDDNIVVPQYFEPFTQKNIDIYGMASSKDIKFRQFKADGDQDRPNKI